METERPPVCVIIGSINHDMTVGLPTLPRRGETVAGGRFSSGPGGKGANQAVIAAHLGAKVYLVGRVGRDEAGRNGRAALVAAGVDDTFLSEDPSEGTGLALIMVGADGENMIGLVSGANAHLTPEMATRAICAVAGDTAHGVLLVSLEVPLATVRAACSAASSHGWTVIVNPAPARTLPDDLLADIDILTPNAVELPQLSSDGAGQLVAAGVGSVVATNGAAGADVWQDAGPPLNVPAFAVEVVDTTGCGDAFSGSLAWAVADGNSLIDAVRLASAAGALTASVSGARARPSAYDLRRLIETS